VLQLKRNGDLEGVKALMPKITVLKAAKSKLENGEIVDADTLPHFNVIFCSFLLPDHL
jgi:hypothetical protein